VIELFSHLSYQIDQSLMFSILSKNVSCRRAFFVECSDNWAGCSPGGAVNMMAGEALPCLISLLREDGALAEEVDGVDCPAWLLGEVELLLLTQHAHVSIPSRAGSVCTQPLRWVRAPAAPPTTHIGIGVVVGGLEPCLQNSEAV